MVSFRLWSLLNDQRLVVSSLLVVNSPWCYSVLSDDHGFSPLHWACREGRSSVVDMLIMRGARINVMNRGDDTPLHLASSHGHRDIVGKVGLSGHTLHTHTCTHTNKHLRSMKVSLG